MAAPTYEELAALVVALQAWIAEQGARIAELEQQQVIDALSRSSKSPTSAPCLTPRYSPSTAEPSSPRR